MAIRVLIVDDEPMIRFALREGLSRLGYECNEAIDGQDCLDQLAGGLWPDVILLDLLMPRKTGAEVLAEMHAWQGSTPPVIVLSGYFDREEFAGLRAVEKLAKPASIDRIVLAIERALAERRDS